MNSPSPSGPNRLAREKSPYLLQHAHNPVDWYPWGGEAFERARTEDKPLFLSIGYSTCHWCHVMERESFEDAEVAALLNAHFVPVKVDREERPDVDRVYMTAMQALGQGGGWPLNVFLTPSLKPFWGGTYFPPRGLHGRPGMVELLPRLAEAWRDQRDQIENTGAQVFAMLDTMARVEDEARPTDEMGAAAAGFLERQHDATCGGFGGAPKFPSPGNLHFLLRRWARGAHGAETGRRMVLAQLEAMRANGLHDHLGGGFHRYATDREWRIPHFEKMLYDQALLADAYVDAFRATGEERWAATARGVFDYVARDLTSKEGAFFSAEDADSEGEEGRFYVWTPAQARDVLGEPDAELFAQHFGVSESGNFEHHTTVLHITREPADAGVAARLDAARAMLLAARSRRPRPHLDDKVVTAWNGLMIAALANGARALGDRSLAKRAERAAQFVWDQLRGPGGELLRRWREGEAAGEGQLDDHAYFAHACLELLLATHDPIWLERSAAVTEVMVDRFWDDADGGFFESPVEPLERAATRRKARAQGAKAGAPARAGAGTSASARSTSTAEASSLPRLKDAFDGAELAGNSLAAEVLWRLGGLLERSAWRDLAKQAFEFHARRIGGAPWAMPRMVASMERAAAEPRHLVIAGRPENADTRALVAVYESRLRPDTDLLVVSAATREALARLAPFAASLPERDGHATAYLCVDHACRQPVHDPVELAAQLDA